MMEVTQYSIKYRPRKWEDIIGQNDIVKNLRNRVIKGNLPKAILLIGQYGTGKTTIAQILSACIQDHLEDGNPNWESPSNKSILNETFDRDTMLLDGSQMSTKDDMIEFTSSLKTKPLYDKNKVFIIEETDQLSTSAQNALLKILEKPTPNVYFILLSMENKISNAIKSRCQVYNVKSFSIVDLMRGMKKVLEENGEWGNKAIPETFFTEGLSTIAMSAKGSFRTALQNLELCLNTEVYTKDAINELLNTVDEITASKIVDGLLNKSKDSILWNNIYKSDPVELYNYISTVLANAMLYKTTGFCEDDRFLTSRKQIATHPNLEKLFDLFMKSPQFTKPYVRKADILGVLADYMREPIKIGTTTEPPKLSRIPVRQVSSLPF